MSDTFNPGEGWRKLQSGERDQDEMIVHYGSEGATSWVREAPVPPLPTEPGAVIQWQDGAYLPQLAQLDPGTGRHGWWAPDEGGDPRWMTAEQLQERLGRDQWTSLEPCAVTAKAVLGKARAYVFQALGEDVDFDHIAREFEGNA